MTKKFVVFAQLTKHKAFATGIDWNDEFTYSFAIDEATVYDWQADAMNACAKRNDECVYFKHDRNDVFEIPPGNRWEYMEI